MKKVLVGSPVRQESQILEQFLLGIEEIIKGDFECYYFFIDDNKEKESSVSLERYHLINIEQSQIKNKDIGIKFGIFLVFTSFNDANKQNKMSIGNNI